jgi:1,4-dihydroxy-2-naphthoyl-CoA synthase
MPLHYATDGYIAYFTIDRPEVHNALDPRPSRAWGGTS